MTTRAKIKDKAAPSPTADMSRDGSLMTRYRPKAFAEVVGQSLAVKALRSVIDKRNAQAFIFAGPSGVGKTTLARITSEAFGASDVREVDAATKTGVDDMRELVEGLQYRNLGDGGGRGVVIDECHMLSKNAWNSLLKAVEEPTGDAFWFFCTTEIGKIPATIKTRCITITLKAVADKDLGKLFDDVCAAEAMDLPGDVGDLIIREANGSPRQLLANLAVCAGATSLREAAALLQTVESKDQTIDICRALVSGRARFTEIRDLIVKMPETVNAESVRIIACNYFAACLKGCKSDRDATKFLNLLSNFATPYNQSEKMAPLYLSVGRCIFEND